MRVFSSHASEAQREVAWRSLRDGGGKRAGQALYPPNLNTRKNAAMWTQLALGRAEAFMPAGSMRQARSPSVADFGTTNTVVALGDGADAAERRVAFET